MMWHVCVLRRRPSQAENAADREGVLPFLPDIITMLEKGDTFEQIASAMILHRLVASSDLIAADIYRQGVPNICKTRLLAKGETCDRQMQLDTARDSVPEQRPQEIWGCSPILSRMGPKSSEFGRISVNIGPISTKFAQPSTLFCQRCPGSTNLGQFSQTLAGTDEILQFWHQLARI